MEKKRKYDNNSLSISLFIFFSISFHLFLHLFSLFLSPSPSLGSLREKKEEYGRRDISGYTVSPNDAPQRAFPCKSEISAARSEFEAKRLANWSNFWLMAKSTLFMELNHLKDNTLQRRCFSQQTPNQEKGSACISGFCVQLTALYKNLPAVNEAQVLYFTFNNLRDKLLTFF